MTAWTASWLSCSAKFRVLISLSRFFGYFDGLALGLLAARRLGGKVKVVGPLPGIEATPLLAGFFVCNAC